MIADIAKVAVVDEEDVVHARQRARLIAELVGFERTDQTRISTAVSEIARNAFQYGGGGTVTFALESDGPAQSLSVTVHDDGSGIAELDAVLEGRFASRTGMGLGLTGARRLMDRFTVVSSPERGTTVSFAKTLPAPAGAVTPEMLQRVATALAGTPAESPLEEVRLQNHELLQTLEELRERQDQLVRLHAELEETNRGVLALYAEVDEKAADLARANAQEVRFLSHVSHEFRTPLSSIIALSDLLLERTDGDLTEEQEKQVRFIHDGATGLSTLVDSLLDLARIEAGKTVVRARPFSVRELFATLRGMLRPVLANDAVELVFDVDADVPELLTDEGMVAQVLRNLLSNAFKFTEAGAIHVRARLSPDGSAVVFSVSDTGIGIAEEDQQSIFDEYTQVEKAGTNGAPGTGLGLPISRRLAEMLGGGITVESAPGAGSTFSAVIPVRYAGPPEASDAGRPPAVTDREAGLGRVLFVGDDAATQVLLEKHLRGTGYALTSARDGNAARATLETLEPVAILLDVPSPEDDATALLAELKADPATGDIPVVTLGPAARQGPSLLPGAADGCTGPIEQSWLLETLGRLGTRPPSRTVLIVDDEEVSRYLLRGHLAGTGHRILEARGGAEALRVARRERPDIVLLDLTMPDMDGLEVLRAIREDPATRDLPVVVVTSRVLGEEERRELEAGARAVLPKTAATRAATLSAVDNALRTPARGHTPRHEEAGDV